MTVLYIDTTTSTLYTGIVKDNKLLDQIKNNFGKDLSKYALKSIDEMFSRNNMKPNDVDKIIVVNGPGSFTGIRVGVTIAKTYAYSLNKKISTISSLEAMALSSKTDSTYKIPVIDARRGYVYGGVFTDDINQVLKQQYLSLETLKVVVDKLIGSYNFITNDNISVENAEKYDPDIEKIVNNIQNREDINPHAVNPIYLKLTEAEEKQNLELI